jgi:DHA1 family inner membrane transport protein
VAFDLTDRFSAIYETCTSQGRIMPLSLFSLILAAFTLGTAEFIIAGLLPAVSVDLGVSVPTAGFLITAYALGVAIGAPVLTMLTRGLPRRSTLLMLVAVFTLGQAFCALAPSYPLLMAARIVVSIGHGAYFGIAAIVATQLAGPQKSGRAIALLLSGITVANILGVPAGTAVGTLFGWRAAFWTVGLFGLIATALLFFALPRDSAPERQAGSIAGEFRVLARPAIYMSFAVIVVAMVGQFAVFTFIAPYLIEVTGIPELYVPWLLLLFGLGSTAGVLIGGRLADWKLMPSLIGMLLALAATYALMAAASYTPIAMAAAILVWAALSFGFGAPVQTRILKAAADAPNLASPLVPTAFNIGIALGASIGAFALDHDWGYVSLPLIGTVAALIATAIALASWQAERRSAAVAEAC